jgi:hypothetical protein
MPTIYYINLDRVSERRHFMEDQFAAQGMTATRISAVDAFDMTPPLNMYPQAGWKDGAFRYQRLRVLKAIALGGGQFGTGRPLSGSLWKTMPFSAQSLAKRSNVCQTQRWISMLSSWMGQIRFSGLGRKSKRTG